MKAVWKFEIRLLDHPVAIDMPVDAQILSVQNQDETIYMWALCSTDAPTVARVFRVVGTGHEHADDGFGLYVGTTLMLSGTLVWHVFEVLQ